MAKTWGSRLVGCGLAILAVVAIMVSPVIYDLATYRNKARDTAEKMTPLIESIYRYKEKTGRWPSELSELVPDYIDQLPDVHWLDYRPGSNEIGPRVNAHTSIHTYLYYYFPEVESGILPSNVSAGWVLDSEGHQEYFPHRAERHR
jgi:hypothetical protein